MFDASLPSNESSICRDENESGAEKERKKQKERKREKERGERKKNHFLHCIGIQKGHSREASAKHLSLVVFWYMSLLDNLFCTQELDDGAFPWSLGLLVAILSPA